MIAFCVKCGYLNKCKVSSVSLYGVVFGDKAYLGGIAEGALNITGYLIAVFIICNSQKLALCVFCNSIKSKLLTLCVVDILFAYLFAIEEKLNSRSV